MPQADQNQGFQKDQPLYTPPPESDKHWLVPTAKPISSVDHFIDSIFRLIRWPAEWFRQNVVEPNRGPKYYWYHRKFNRALPLDECYVDDDACIYEANMEFNRIRQVDKFTLDILKNRKDACYVYYKSDRGLDHGISEKCKEISETYDREEENFAIKYAELPFRATVLHAYTKQKHRMIVERRRAEKQKQLEAFEASE